MRTDEQIISTIEMKQGKKKYLDYNDFKNMVHSLSRSQGFYGRLYENLLELEKSPEDLKTFKKQIKDLKATDKLDFILWLEG